MFDIAQEAGPDNGKAGKRVNFFGAWNTCLTWHQISNVEFKKRFKQPSKAKFSQGRIVAISIITNSDADYIKVLGNANSFLVFSSFI